MKKRNERNYQDSQNDRETRYPTQNFPEEILKTGNDSSLLYSYSLKTFYNFQRKMSRVLNVAYIYICSLINRPSSRLRRQSVGAIPHQKNFLLNFLSNETDFRKSIVPRVGGSIRVLLVHVERGGERFPEVGPYLGRV